MPLHTRLIAHILVLALRLSNVVGSFKKVDAQIDADGEKLNKLSATIKTASVFTDNDARDKHLQSADFFDANKYPDMKFEMTEFTGDKVKGSLTIKDITKPVELEYEFGGKTTDNKGKEHIGFSLEGEVKRSEFNFAPESGELTLGDKIKINVEVEAIVK